MRADLHIHSNNSDGTDTVETIIDKACKKGLDVIAITDHDNVGGVERALEYAKGKINLISGIELSTYSEENDNLEVHVLGYGVDYKSELLIEKTSNFLNERSIRFYKIIDKLREKGIKISKYDFNESCAGRLAIAKMMLRRGAVSSIQEAFDKYLGENGSCFIPSMRISTIDGVRLICQVGGKPVLAHPEKYLKAGILEDMLERLTKEGLFGMECFYPSHCPETVARLTVLADRFGLVKTVGSDYHGKNKVVDIGEVNVDISRETLEALAGHSLA